MCVCVCVCQVRKTSQAALLVLLEQELIERGDVEKLVCPVLVELTAPDRSDEVKTEAMAVREHARFDPQEMHSEYRDKRFGLISLY